MEQVMIALGRAVGVQRRALLPAILKDGQVDVLVVLKDAEFEIFLHVLVSLSKSAAGAAEVFSYIIYQNDSTL